MGIIGFVILLIVLIIVSFLGGISFKSNYDSNAIKKEHLEKKNEETKIWENVLDVLNKNLSTFSNRVFKTAYIRLYLTEYKSQVNLIYMVDNENFAITNDSGEVLLTNQLLDEDFIQKIKSTIIKIHGKEIYDTASIFGTIEVDKKTFNNIFGVSEEELNKIVENFNKKVDEMNEGEEWKKNIDNNEKTYDIDEILEKISKVGLENITPEERNFLDNYDE